MEGSDALGLYTVEMCLVPGVVIPAKFKVLDFESIKGPVNLGHIFGYIA